MSKLNLTIEELNSQMTISNLINSIENLSIIDADMLLSLEGQLLTLKNK